MVVQIQKHFRLILNHHPVRSIKGSFAIFLLMSRPPLLARRGNVAVRQKGARQHGFAERIFRTHAAARLSASMSIFTIFIKACVTFFTFSGSLFCMSWPRIVGTICHDKPYLSLSHPH